MTNTLIVASERLEMERVGVASVQCVVPPRTSSGLHLSRCDLALCTLLSCLYAE